MAEVSFPQCLMCYLSRLVTECSHSSFPQGFFPSVNCLIFSLSPPHWMCWCYFCMDSWQMMMQYTLLKLLPYPLLYLYCEPKTTEVLSKGFPTAVFLPTRNIHSWLWWSHMIGSSSHWRPSQSITFTGLISVYTF